MLIILGLYFGAIWLVFSKFNLLPWNTAWKTCVYGIALVIALVVVGALNHTTPTGSVSVQGVVIQVKPNVSGTVTEVSVTPNVPIKKGDVLFKIDPTTMVADVASAEAGLEAAFSAAEQLKFDLQAADAEIESLEAQLKFGIQRRDDIVVLEERGASAGFQMQEAVSTIEQLTAGIRGAKARRASLQRRISATIGDVDIGVIEAQETLVKATWALEQTVVRAPADGVVTALDLRVGDRVAPVSGVLSFASPSDRVFVASLPQTSRQNVAVGDILRVALGTLPGTEISAPITAIPFGSAEGVFSPRNGLPSIREVGGGSQYIVKMDIPADVPTEAVQLGASGTVLIITDEAGAIGVLAEILFWISKMLNYL